MESCVHLASIVTSVCRAHLENNIQVRLDGSFPPSSKNVVCSPFPRQGDLGEITRTVAQGKLGNRHDGFAA